MPAFNSEIRDIQALPLAELMSEALKAKRIYRGAKFSLCSIINAKSGHCSEDCRFCVQSGRYKTDTPLYPLKSVQEIVTAAQEAKRIGSQRFSIVTSGRGMPANELAQVAETIKTIRAEVDIEVCASLGIQTREDFELLKQAGLSRYHHNIETSREFFPKVVTTHTFSDRIATIYAAMEAGLEVCAGGIFGLGETEDDRISMALTLKECSVVSVPINILIPLPGTPLADAPPLSISAILRAIALFRLIMKGGAIRLAAGRETILKEFLSAALLAGADGMMIGGYLTQKGRMPEEDHQLVKEIVEIWTA